MFAQSSSLICARPRTIASSLALSGIHGGTHGLGRSKWVSQNAQHTTSLSRPPSHALLSTTDHTLVLGYCTPSSCRRQVVTSCHSLPLVQAKRPSRPPRPQSVVPKLCSSPLSMVFPRSHRQLGHGDISLLPAGPLVQQHARRGPTARFRPITQERGLSPQLQPGCCCTLPNSTTPAEFGR